MRVKNLAIMSFWESWRPTWLNQSKHVINIKLIISYLNISNSLLYIHLLWTYIFTARKQDEHDQILTPFLPFTVENDIITKTQNFKSYFSAKRIVTNRKSLENKVRFK